MRAHTFSEAQSCHAAHPPRRTLPGAAATLFPATVASLPRGVRGSWDTHRDNGCSRTARRSSAPAAWHWKTRPGWRVNETRARDARRRAGSPWDRGSGPAPGIRETARTPPPGPAALPLRSVPGGGGASQAAGEAKADAVDAHGRIVRATAGGQHILRRILP